MIHERPRLIGHQLSQAAFARPGSVQAFRPPSATAPIPLAIVMRPWTKNSPARTPCKHNSVPLSRVAATFIEACGGPVANGVYVHKCRVTRFASCLRLIQGPERRTISGSRFVANQFRNTRAGPHQEARASHSSGRPGSAENTILYPRHAGQLSAFQAAGDAELSGLDIL